LFSIFASNSSSDCSIYGYVVRLCLRPVPFRIRSDCVCRCKKRLMEDEGKSDLGDEVFSRICMYVFVVDTFEEEEGEWCRTRVL
jgi:hypothetical protein